jgi:hypothetical protein
LLWLFWRWGVGLSKYLPELVLIQSAPLCYSQFNPLLIPPYLSLPSS